MILDIRFDQPVSTYLDLVFDNPFGDEGVDAESVADTALTFTTTYANGLRERLSVDDLDGTSFRLGDFDILDPVGDSIVTIATGAAGIVTGNIDTLDLSGIVDRARIAFTEADDIVPLTLDLAIAQTRGERTETVLDLARDLPLTFDFGDGLDRAVLDAVRADVQASLKDGVFDLTTATARGEFLGLETVEFADGALLLDQGGEFADYAYALYAAALARTPDEEGLRFWNGVMDSGAFSGGTREEAEARLAAEFVRADEFAERFDVSTNAAFVNALYDNVLGRAADTEGFDFWLGAFDTGELGREDMLRFFAISDENAARIADDIADGYWVI